MSFPAWNLPSKRKRAESKWIKHEKCCARCHAAQSPAGYCDKGNLLIAQYVQKQVDCENAESKRLGVSYAQLMAGGAR